ncbi:MAG: hypothetical protein KAU58_02365 [Candidatus Omnitrophica bacterium]|nr:hypothetical protein [Candidatus Omnitrophota bacterium]
MKIAKYITGALLIPLAIGFSKAFYAGFLNLDYINVRLPLFLWGIVLYMLMHILFFKPTYFYTLGHEAIHVLATWLCGGHITSFSVSRWGGSVSTSKTNFFIELSPYFVPIYTIVLILIAPLIKSKLVNIHILSCYIFSLGFTLGMHLIMTAEALKLKQTDIMKSGYPFSLMIIYVANLLIVFFILSLFTKDLSFKAYFLKSLDYSKNIYFSIWNKLF